MAEPLSIAECRRGLTTFHSTVARLSSQSAQTLRGISFKQKVIILSLSAGGVALYYATKLFFRENKKALPDTGDASGSRSLRAAAARKARRGTSAASTRSVASASSTYNWSELQKAFAADATYGVNCGGDGGMMTLVDGVTPLTPQQLGLMGMEALETVVGYWEDALTAYNASRPNPDSRARPNQKSLVSPEETEFTRLLENILDGAYQLQDDAEHMFIHQHSILYRQKDKNRLFESSGSGQQRQAETRLYRASTAPSSRAASTVAAGAATTSTAAQQNNQDEVVDGSVTSGGWSHVKSRNHLISFSSVDDESFVSAQDTIADLKDFEDFDFNGEPRTDDMELYEQAMNHLEKSGIPCRILRTEFVGVQSDAEYLAKLHCLRLGFKKIMENQDYKTWWEDTGRSVISGLIIKSQKDPKDYVCAYDELLDYLNGPEENTTLMAEELKSRNVKITNFYDVAFDYILIDSFEDLETPPSSVVAVMKNRWLSNGFKEGALQTAVWSVIAAKRRLLKNTTGFKSKFYNISEVLLPILAWGFFGPDEEINNIMNFFKEQVLSFIRDLYNFDHIRYSSVDILSEDIMNLARSRVEATLEQVNIQFFDEQMPS